jgi:hypothetical protein
MWRGSVRSDIPSSRGQSGSSGDQDGLGIPSRSAPASATDVLIDKLESALRELKADGDRVGHELLQSLALGQAEQAIRRWRAEKPSRSRRIISLGRPTVLEGDVRLLRALREANPNSDCWVEFSGAIGRGFGKHWVRARYREANRAIATMER